jgi:hypothetical protein
MNVQQLFVNQPCLDEHGVIVGSGFSEDAQLGPVQAAGVLNMQQIMRKHNLTLADYYRIKKQVQSTRVLDAMFRWPDGPRYDILLYLIANCR